MTSLPCVFHLQDKWVKTIEGRVRYMDDRYVVVSKWPYPKTSFIDIPNGNTIAIDQNAATYSAVTDESCVYYSTTHALKKLDLGNRAYTTLFPIPINEQVDFKIFLYHKNIVFGTGENIYFIDKQSGDVTYKIQTDMIPELQLGDIFYCYSKFSIGKLDCKEMLFKWYSNVNDLGLKGGFVYTPINKFLIAYNDFVFYLYFDNCYTMSTYINCISGEYGKLLWNKKIFGNIRFLDIFNDSILISEDGDDAKLLKLSIKDKSLSAITDLSSLAYPLYLSNDYLIYGNRNNICFLNINYPMIKSEIKKEFEYFEIYKGLLLIENAGKIELYKIKGL